MQLIQLRPRQALALDMLRQSFADSHRAPLLVAPCGYGKTRVAAAISSAAVSKGKNVLFITPRRNLVAQAVKSFANLGIEAGVHMAGELHDNRHPINIASMDTIISRAGKQTDALQGILDADLICIDEAHTAISPKRKALLLGCLGGDYATRKKLIGLTASPCLGSGGGLGAIFDDLLMPTTMQDEIKDGHLLQPRYFACEKPDLSKVKMVGGEYSSADLGVAYDDADIMGNVVDNYARIAPGTAAICFTPIRSNAAYLAKQFEAAGYPSAYLDANTPDNERQRVFDGIEDGSIKIITNVLIVGMGTDLPPVQTVICATATKSIPRWVQAVGRPLRPYGDQDCAYIIDHGGMCIDPNMGRVEDITDWTLDPKIKVQDKVLQRKKDNAEPKEITCTKCKTIFRSRRDCPACGHVMIAASEPLKFYHTDLTEIRYSVKEKRQQLRNSTATEEDKIRFWQQCIYSARYKNLKCGAAAWMYKNEYGVWPRGFNDMPKGREWKLSAREFLSA